MSQATEPPTTVAEVAQPSATLDSGQALARLALTQVKVPKSGYIALIFALVVFSGVLARAKGWIQVFDLNTLNGQFGTMKDAARNTFTGIGGSGARDGFLFALTLVPAVMTALGLMEVIDYFGGLKAAQKLLTPLLRPLLGIPGLCGLALVTSFQNTDAGAGMTRGLREADLITDKERKIFVSFQFTGGAPITNYFVSGSALFLFMTQPIIVPLALIFVLKVFGANLMRLYLRFVPEKGER